MPHSTSWLPLLAFLLLVSAPVSSAEGTAGNSTLIKGSRICVCRCCYLGDCSPIKDGTFEADECSSCTNQECEQRFPGRCTCGTRFVLKGECYNRNAPFPKFTCILLLTLLGGLIVFGVSKNYIPILNSFNVRHFSY
eukprot:Sspe_Gene.110592::Locus_91648_Transcript_2_2_Confidence_0.875_Length_508::g.110592::m.110592